MRPSPREIEALLASPAAIHSYPEVGATAKLESPEELAELATRYDVDRHEFPLGRGRDLLGRAQSALAAWRHFEIPWLELHGAKPIARGDVVATLVRVAGLWFLNPCRVVYVEPASDGEGFAFAYGTLPGHAERGEERFEVRLDPETGEVRYRIAAFSRPATFWSKAGYPLARRIQRRFASSSAEALRRAIA